jgi:hypothetical protein
MRQDTPEYRPIAGRKSRHCCGADHGLRFRFAARTGGHLGHQLSQCFVLRGFVVFMVFMVLMVRTLEFMVLVMTAFEFLQDRFVFMVRPLKLMMLMVFVVFMVWTLELMVLVMTAFEFLQDRFVFMVRPLKLMMLMVFMVLMVRALEFMVFVMTALEFLQDRFVFMVFMVGPLELMMLVMTASLQLPFELALPLKLSFQHLAGDLPDFAADGATDDRSHDWSRDLSHAANDFPGAIDKSAHATSQLPEPSEKLLPFVFIFELAFELTFEFILQLQFQFGFVIGSHALPSLQELRHPEE